MNWKTFFRGLSTALALSLLIFSAGCATGDVQRLGQARASSAEAGLVGQAVAQAEAERIASRQIPDLPTDCRASERSGVAAGDRLDAALLKTDAALGRANARVGRCAAWHDAYRRGIGGPP